MQLQYSILPSNKLSAIRKQINFCLIFKLGGFAGIDVCLFILRNLMITNSIFTQTEYLYPAYVICNRPEDRLINTLNNIYSELSVIYKTSSPTHGAFS